MRMICRYCKRIMTLSELTGYACGHFASWAISIGLAAWLAAALQNYFSNPRRGPLDDTMAGACNGLKMACPNCEKTSCWDAFPEITQQPQEEKTTNPNNIEP
jgi:hypothetical protein